MSASFVLLRLMHRQIAKPRMSTPPAPAATTRIPREPDSSLEALGPAVASAEEPPLSAFLFFPRSLIPTVVYGCTSAIRALLVETSCDVEMVSDEPLGKGRSERVRVLMLFVFVVFCCWCVIVVYFILY